jgi:hypothetical protein
MTTFYIMLLISTIQTSPHVSRISISQREWSESEFMCLGLKYQESVMGLLFEVFLTFFFNILNWFVEELLICTQFAGTTPARTDRSYPRYLAATSPHERILGRWECIACSSFFQMIKIWFKPLKWGPKKIVYRQWDDSGSGPDLV